MAKPKTIWLLSGILLLMNISVYFFKLGGDSLSLVFSTSFSIVSSFLAAFCLYGAYNSFKVYDRAKFSWLMIYLGVLMYFIAECMYGIGESVLNINMDQAFPTAADFVWMTAYIPFILGCSIMIFSYVKSGFLAGSLRFYVWSSIPFIALAGLLVSFLLIPIAVDIEVPAMDKFVYIYYPIADLILVMEAGLLMYITSLFGQGSITKAWKYISAGLVLMTIADLLYSYLNWSGKYNLGNFIDIEWVASYLFIAIGAVYQRQLMDNLNEGNIDGI